MEAAEISQTKRIVLLIDLHPLLFLENPNHYLSSVLLSAQNLLSFPSLSTSLFAFKPFFSSLSPFLSTSRAHRLLGKSASFLSFDLPSATLHSLSLALDSLPSPAVPDPDNESLRLRPSRASLTAESLFQLTYDCSWEPKSGDLGGGFSFCSLKSNMVVLFSHLPRSLECLADFIDVGVDDNSLVNVESFCKKFAKTFSSVNGLLTSNDVQLCWIDVNFDSDCGKEVFGSQFLRRGIEGMGWGLCSTDAIILGSILVPFGLIFPQIGCRPSFESSAEVWKGRAELSLQISDVSGKPLECKCCELQVLDLGLQINRSDICVFSSGDSGNGIARICIKEVCKIDEMIKANVNVSSLLLVSGDVEECRKDRKVDPSSEFFADRILELLKGRCEYVLGKPIWQLVLAFLSRRKLWTLVSISRGDGCSLMGIIKPFTVHSAVLCVLANTKDCDRLSEPSSSLQLSNAHTLSESTGSIDLGDSRKRNKKHLDVLCKLSWRSFCESVFSQSDDVCSGVELEDVYIAKECNKSKKLRFLQCWMRQMKKSNSCSLIKLSSENYQQDTQEETEEGVVRSQEETEHAVSSLSTVRETIPNQSEKEEPLLTAGVEDLESFTGSISQKIEHGLCSEEVDLGDLAERLVEMAIHAVHVTFQKKVQRNPVGEASADSCDSEIAAEVSKVLLLKPKDLAAKYKATNSSASAPNLSSAISYTDKKVREHELQILFRMEILRSSIGTSVEENTKEKIIKEICMLLQNIEFNLQGGMFTGESLIEFSERTINSRYAHSLGDTIHRIYTQMEFFSFDGGGEEDSCSLPNSNNNDEAPICRENNSVSEDIGDCMPDKFAPSNPQASKAEQNPREDAKDCQLRKARERRERAQRFSHFTSQMQNLQRVWAPKKLKVEKSMHESANNQLGRRRRHTSYSDMVLETPMMGKKHNIAQESEYTEKHVQRGTASNRSLSKALFQDEDDS